MQTSLNISAIAHAQLREDLKRIFLLEEDDPALCDTLDGESDFKELVGQAIMEARVAEEMAEGIARVIEQLMERKTRLIGKKEKIRAAVAQAMQEAGETKITTPCATLSLSMGKPTLVFRVTEPTEDGRFVRTKTERSWDKTEVFKALQRGDEDAASIAHLSNGKPVLTVYKK